VWLGFDQPQTILPGGYAGDLAVPMWATFMKVATAGDKPDAFAFPKGLVAVQVCRLSGKLPAEGCSDVEVVSDTGDVSRRSMIYTDYFLRGQEPTEQCPLHDGSSLLNKFTEMFGHGHPASAPVNAGVIGVVKDVPPNAAEARGAPLPAAQTPPDQPAKKRGFWSRVFRGKDDKPKPPPASNAPNQP
jgi:hypothetical protein